MSKGTLAILLGKMGLGFMITSFGGGCGCIGRTAVGPAGNGRGLVWRNGQ